MSLKNSRGKQKLRIKKIENYKDRMIECSRRRDEIYTKLSELSVTCGADVAFLMISSNGKPYTFGSPSFEAVAKRFLNGEGSSQSIMDQQYKVNLEELYKVYNNVLEKSNAEKEKGMKLKAEVEALLLESDAWWRIDPSEINEYEDAKKIMEKYEEVYEKLCDEVVARKHGGSAP